jgi:hypothetical protein
MVTQHCVRRETVDAGTGCGMLHSNETHEAKVRTSGPKGVVTTAMFVLIVDNTGR